MPAERTRGSRRTESDGQKLVWTLPVEPIDNSGVSFTTNVTPITFSDGPPPLVDPPSHEFILFPPLDESSNSAPRRPAHSKKKPENHIPRPPNAFILFRSSFIKSQHVSTEVETNHSTLSKIIGLTWQNLPDKERQIWHSKAKQALEEHKRKFPQYAFRPTQGRKGAPDKRRVREVEPKDLKRCAKIAELLASGHKGRELEEAMAEFDKHHVHEVVTRFEAPITAKAYRRSSSAPVPETDSSKAAKSFFSTVTSLKKARASSTRPTRCSTPQLVPSQSTQPMKQEPSLDFSSFSFDRVGSPLQTLNYDPLLDLVPSSPVGSHTHSQHMFSSPLSIDTSTSFLSDWSQCASPLSPETPNFLSTPSPSPFQEGLDTMHIPMEKTLPELTSAYPNYSQCGLDMGLHSDSYLNITSDYPNFHSLGPPSEPNHLDIDFSAFVNTALHSYPL